MKFAFKNIDKTYNKLRHEVLGDIQPKYWFREKNGTQLVLVKRQHSQKVIGQAKKSKMFNHFGEYFGYHLAKKAGVSACPVDIVTLHDYKNKYAKNKNLYTACASHSLKKKEQSIYLGEMVISKFKCRDIGRYREILIARDDKILDLSKGKIDMNSHDDNVDIVLASIVSETMEYEKKMGLRTEEQIKSDIDTNLQNAVEMIVYDCVFGNSDRHSQNWAMLYDEEEGTVQMYPNYDNEAVLGLRKTEFEIRNSVGHIDQLSDYMERESFSRMGIAPENSGVTYKNMLEHLVNKYPTYAIPAMKKITDRVKLQDVEELYEAAIGITERSEVAEELTEEDELPEAYRVYGTRLYSERRTFARNLVKKYEERQSFLRKVNQREKELML